MCVLIGRVTGIMWWVVCVLMSQSGSEQYAPNQSVLAYNPDGLLSCRVEDVNVGVVAHGSDGGPIAGHAVAGGAHAWKNQSQSIIIKLNKLLS